MTARKPTPRTPAQAWAEADRALDAIGERLEAILAAYPLARWTSDTEPDAEGDRWGDRVLFQLELSREELRALGVRLPAGWTAALIAVSRQGEFVEEVERV